MVRQQGISSGQVCHYKRRVGKYGCIFYEVRWHPGEPRKGHHVIVNFALKNRPLITVEENYVDNPTGLTGHWRQFGKVEPISGPEFHGAYTLALNHPKVALK